jgi:hypothetical protein
MSSLTASKNGVFGAEIVLNTRSGQACLRSDYGSVTGAPPPPLTNAFFVWVGRPVIVVSEGVGTEDVDRIANALRSFVGVEHIPILFDLGRNAVGRVCAMASPASAGLLRELALAEAYVLVQCAWSEADRLRIEVDGRGFDFRVEFHRELDGSFVLFIA